MNTMQKLHEAALLIGIVEDVTSKVDEIKRERHVTFGDVANIAATEIPRAIEASGLSDQLFRAHVPPVKRGPRAPKDAAG